VSASARPHVHRRDRPERHERRTQAERTAETTAKLLDATAECLAELGYARTTTTEICRRAGVSRGAMLHHFPSKAVLVAAACEHVFEPWAEEVRTAMARVPEGDDRLAAVIDVLWSLFQDHAFAAWYELVMAGRTDPDLRPHVALVAARLDETVVSTWRDLFAPDPALDPEWVALFDTAPLLMFAVLMGLSLELMTGKPAAAADAARVLDFVKLAAGVLGPGDPPTPEESR
jgi:AcrR family transcriptional regulator